MSDNEPVHEVIEENHQTSPEKSVKKSKPVSAEYLHSNAISSSFV